MPSNIPSVQPRSSTPSLAPSATPSKMPPLTPSVEPSVLPSKSPSIQPSSMPSISSSPSRTPTSMPSDKPSMLPSLNPSTLMEGLSALFQEDEENGGDDEDAPPGSTTMDGSGSGAMTLFSDSTNNRRSLSSSSASSASGSRFSSFKVPLDSITEIMVESPSDFIFDNNSSGSFDASFGLMIRETKSDSTSRYIKVFRRETDNVKTISAVERTDVGGTETIIGDVISLSSSSEAVSLKITKAGNMYSIYYRLDDGIFNLLHKSAIDMIPGADGQLHAGLFVASEHTDPVGIEFENFSFKKGYYMQENMIGADSSGSVFGLSLDDKLRQSDSATITGGGGEISGTSDNIFFGSMLVPSDPEFEVIVNVKGGFIDAASPLTNGAKFGLLVRDSLEASSAFVNVFTMVYDNGRKFSVKHLERTCNGCEVVKKKESTLDTNDISMKLMKIGNKYLSYFKKHGADEQYKLVGMSDVDDVTSSTLLNVGVFASSRNSASIKFDSFSYKDDTICEEFLSNSGKMGNTCKCFDGFSFDTGTGTCKGDTVINTNVPSLKIVHATETSSNEVSTSFAGSYGGPEGSFNQDFDGGGGVIGASDGSMVTMIGNAWKIYELPGGVPTKKNTWLEFDFESIEDAEGHAICLDENRFEDTVSRIHNRCIAIENSDSSLNQVDKWYMVKKINKNSSGTYRMNVGEELFGGFYRNIKFLAIIQDNDSLPSTGRSTFSNIRIYDVPIVTGPPEAFLWERASDSNVAVSTHANRVTVSEDGIKAVYGSADGNVHLITKPTGSSCPNSSFPGCLQTTWATWLHASTGRTHGFSEEQGYSEYRLQGYKGMNCYGGRCDNKHLLYNVVTEYLYKDGGYWTGWFSEEQGGMQCNGNSYVTQIHCSGDNCDNMRLRCNEVAPEYQTTGDIRTTGWFSDENGDQYCSDGYYIFGLTCGGKDCDNLRLRCRRIEARQYPSLVHSGWSDYYLLPPESSLNPRQTVAKPSTCPSGSVSQSDCHLAGIAAASQIKWSTTDWREFNVHSSGSKPCGCYIEDERTISYNTNDTCAYSSSARSVCKPDNPSRGANIVLARPGEIAPGEGFGDGPKVLSTNANTIAIAASNKVAIFTTNGSNASTLRNIVDGDKAAVSPDGFAVSTVTSASASSKCKVSIYGRNSDSSFVKTGDALNDFTCSSLNSGIAIGHQTNAVQLYTTGSAYNLSCNVENSRVETGLANSPIVCICDDGYWNSGPNSGKVLEQEWSCISSLASDQVAVTSSTIEFSLLIETSDKYPVTQLIKRADDNDIPITLTSKKLNKVNTGNRKMRMYTLAQLLPGSRYSVTVFTEDNSRSLSFPGVTTCSCGDDDIDKTGKPTHVKVIQENGHVMFNFRDNSKCEDSFSLTRTDEAEEFLADISENGVSFTRDYFFTGGKECGSEITTETDASDDLSYSHLPVGKLYMYCVRAVHSLHYMDHPLDTEGIRQMKSSDDTCTPHKIRWEASIHGKVTTEPNAGSLPVEDVEVTWELLDTNLARIGCDGCSGSASTTEGGTFEIAFNVDDPFFKDKNYVDVPVEIKFSKMSGDISHKFLCNAGEDDCSGDIGTIMYLKHLEFKEPIHVFDDTSLPFSGKVFIHDTIYPGSEGCLLSNVEMCLIQERNVGPTKTNETLVCGETGPDGTYSVPIIIGSTIDYVDLKYHEHAFRPSLGSSFESGMVIQEDGYYGDNDFEDYEKTELMVDIVGGLCNKRLGTSKVHMQIVGCAWNENDPLLPEPETFTQTGTRRVYDRVPAHLLNIQVLDVTDNEDARVENVYGAFQGERPLLRTIDLRSNNGASNAMEQVDESQNVTTSKGIAEEDELRTDTANSVESMEEEEEEGMDLVRFQYDGELTMDVEVSNDELTCTNYNLEDDYDGADSLHVLEYMSGFAVTVKPKYVLIEKQNLFCDIMDDDLKLHIVNQVGIDSNEGFDEFLEAMELKDKGAANLLEKCRDTGCLFDIDHDEDEDGNKTGGAIVRTFFATGRPNIASPYTKNMIFSIQGGTASATHRAAIIVGGYFSKGPGNSFALPTHKPLMVLRDPPGGLSYATYENVKTTIALETSSTSKTVHNHFGFSFKHVLQGNTGLCGGGGAPGPISLSCTQFLQADSKTLLVGYDHDLGGTVQQSDKTKSTEFTTTWSYETSSDPWTAGAMSDVFVVPNLNVMYREVYVVKWSDKTCAVEEDADGTLPITTTVNLEDEENQPALAFYSRYHVESTKLPELERSAENIETVRTSADCDCDNQDDDEFMCSFGEDEEASCGALKQQVAYLNNAIAEWKEYMKPKEDFKGNSIVNWFEKVGQGLMKDEDGDKYLDIVPEDNESHHSSALAPPTLLSGAEKVANAPKKENGEDTNLKDIKRIQFSGGGNTYSMTLSKENMWDKVGLSCWDGCNNEYESEISGPGLDEWKMLLGGFGFELNLLPLNFKTHVLHESTKEETDTESTSIGFTLGDDDQGDEIVVDLYYDEKFGTVIFDTVAGRSKCPHEIGTIAIESPELNIVSYPSQNVFPDEDMVFEFEMSNKGDGGSSDFILFASQSDNNGNLEIVLDGSALVDDRGFTSFPQDTTIKKTLVVRRGPRMFEYSPIDLFMGSACEADSTITLENAKKVSQKLYNRGAGENTLIKFLKECPKVEWAGELLRDRHFVVNTNSDDQENLKVTASNPNYGEMSFHKMMTTDRLESVLLYYRELGDLQQFTERARVEIEVDGKAESREVDYAAAYANEDNYGYETMKWALANKVPEGRYEIMVEAACEHIDDAPDPINFFRTPVLTGVIDLTRPEQYGRELPLREEVLLGEEISVVFTEPILCEKPFTFDVKVIIEGTPYEFDREELQVVCEGRRIGFQIDPTVGIDVETILGKKFTVEIGRVGNDSVSNVFDVNGNAINPLVGNVKFEKKFREINLQGASSRFLLTMNSDDPCDHDVTEDDMKMKVASILDVTSTERLTLKKLTSCHDGIGATAEVTITPASSSDRGGRMLREKQEVHSVGLFYQLRDTALEIEAGTRKLSFDGDKDHMGVSSAWSFAVSQMKILPSASDMKTLKTTDPDLVEEEEELLRLASLGDTREDKHNDMILREVRMGLKREHEKMESFMAAEREHEDERMEELRKHEAEKLKDLAATLQTNEDEKMEIMLEKMQQTLAEAAAGSKQEIQSLHNQLTVVTMICVVVSVAAFLKLKQ